MSVLVCYGKVNPDIVRGYKYVIVESEQYTAFDIKLLKENNELVLGYISVGEVSPSRSYYEEIKDKTLGKNKIWESYFLDLDDETTKAVLLTMASQIENKGFDGLFLDTVDNYAKWGPFADRGGDMVEILRLLKEAHPNFHLMQNAGLSLIPATASYVSSVAIESVASDYNFNKEQYGMRKQREFYEKVEELQSIERQHGLPIILIEYADSKRLYNKILNQILSLEWDYFVGSVELQDLPKFK